MSEPRAGSIRFAPVVAAILGVAALVLAPVAPAFLPIALILAIAGVLVGGVAAYNHRRDRVNLYVGVAGAAVAAGALVVTLALIAA